MSIKKLNVLTVPSVRTLFSIRCLLVVAVTHFVLRVLLPPIRTENRGKTCPLCHNKFTSQRDEQLERILDGSKVYCPNRNKGCDWIGDLGQCDSHLGIHRPVYHRLRNRELKPEYYILNLGSKLQDKSYCQFQEIDEYYSLKSRSDHQIELRKQSQVKLAQFQEADEYYSLNDLLDGAKYQGSKKQFQSAQDRQLDTDFIQVITATVLIFAAVIFITQSSVTTQWIPTLYNDIKTKMVDIITHTYSSSISTDSEMQCATHDVAGMKDYKLLLAADKNSDHNVDSVKSHTFTHHDMCERKGTESQTQLHMDSARTKDYKRGESYNNVVLYYTSLLIESIDSMIITFFTTVLMIMFLRAGNYLVQGLRALIYNIIIVFLFVNTLLIWIPLLYEHLFKCDIKTKNVMADVTTCRDYCSTSTGSEMQSATTDTRTMPTCDVSSGVEVQGNMYTYYNVIFHIILAILIMIAFLKIGNYLQNLEVREHHINVARNLSIPACLHDENELHLFASGIPSISNYFFAANNIASVPFVGEVELITCDSQGCEYWNPDHDITIRIPPGAIPPGMTVQIEVAVTLYGPFQFQNNSFPVSPILWLCCQNIVTFKKPIEIILPHFVNDTAGTQKNVINFAKADHRSYLVDKSGMKCYVFKPVDTAFIDIKEGQQNYGLLPINHCCFFCITADSSFSADIAPGYCFWCIEKPLSPPQSRDAVLLCTTFFLSTCRTVSKNCNVCH